MEIQIIIVGSILLVIVFYFVLVKKKRVKKTRTPQELGSPENILKEVEVYMSYGLDTKAVKLLKDARSAYPGDANIKRKLSELTNK